MTERTTVRLPEDLLRRAKRKAVTEGRTLTALIEDGLRLMVADKSKSTSKKRVYPRISSATGGPMPGFENMKFSELQELDDLEYVERMKHFRP
jgi:hypothetical protein